VTFQVAQLARQQFAEDIYAALRVVTGAPDPSTVTFPSDDANTLRWLAQLAVNIVDYVDSDDYITPFKWFDDGKGNQQWVFGTEIPRVVLNEAYVEQTPAGAATDPATFNVWVELYNSFTRDNTLADRGAAKLEMPAAGGAARYGVYQLVITKPNTGLRNRDNVLGAPDPGATQVLSTLSTFVPAGSAFVLPPVPYPPEIPPPALPALDPDPRFILPSGGRVAGTNGSNRGYYLLGPTVAFPGAGATGPTATLQRSEMTYKTVLGTKPTLLLQRLACPHLPPQPDPTKALYNPYVTVDYMENVPVNTSTDGIATRKSVGRQQPYAGSSGQLVAQAPTPALATQPQHTFFNANSPRTNPFNWLVHPDRQLISPMELLHVSAFKPHELTQQFVTGTAAAPAAFQHYAPWFDKGLAAGNSARLYRLMEFLETRSRASGLTAVATTATDPVTKPGTVAVHCPLTGTTGAGLAWAIQPGAVLAIEPGTVREENVRVISVDTTAKTFTANFLKPHPDPAGAATTFRVVLTMTGGRIPGKININTIWDIETFQALCDSQKPNGFTAAQVNTLFKAMIDSRTKPRATDVPNTVTSAGTPTDQDKPFLSLATGLTAAKDQQYPNGISIEDTLLRSDGAGNRLFQVPPPTAPTPDHPYRQAELLTKIFSQVTTRSNVFAVWVTVGFFEVTDDTTRPVKLGAEIGRAQNRQVRHRMFAIVNRANLASNPGPASQARFNPHNNPNTVLYYSIID
jgi:hypothetical protein